MSDPMLLVVMVTLLFLVITAFGMVLGRMRTRETIYCAPMASNFTVDFVRHLGPSWGPAGKIDVLRCTRFDDPECISCEKGCVREPAEALVPR